MTTPPSGEPGHGHGHGAHGDAGHGHGHAHGQPSNFGRAFAIGVALQGTFVVVEVVLGLAANSLAVLSDAGHNVSDVLALVLAWGATTLGRRRSTTRRTYGWKSASILAAVVNSLSLVFVNGAVAWEAVLRLREPEPVTTTIMIFVSLAGVCVNAISAWLFARGNKDDVNIRAAFLHLASDAVVAAGVALAGVLIHFTHWYWLDSAVSLLVSAILVVMTWSLVRRAIDLAMHAVPESIDESAVRAWLTAFPGVVELHDLHIWAMSTTENVLTAHVVVRDMPTGAMACEMDAGLQKTFPLHHVTIQIDPHDARCALAEETTI